MKLCTFELNTLVGRVRRIGVVTPAGVLDATAARIAHLEGRYPAALAAHVGRAQVPPELESVLGYGRQGIEWIREAADAVLSSDRAETREGARLLYQLQDVHLIAPVPRPPGIACFATWKAHIEDSAAKGFSSLKFPEEGSELRPYYKGNPDSVIGPNAVLKRPPYAAELDVECELAAVVGTGGCDLTPEQARESIAGYCIYNDVSCREIQIREMHMGLGPTKGKDHDGGNVLGPWLVTADEVGNARDLTMSLTVNGEEWSSYSSSHMAWDFADLLSYLSRGQTIRPGHVLTSGCFPGGSALDTNRKLKSGDVVELKISKLGSLVNEIE